MKIQRKLNKQKNLKTRKVRGTYIKCCYSMKVMESDEVAISFSDKLSDENVWIKLKESENIVNSYENLENEPSLGLGNENRLKIGKGFFLYKLKKQQIKYLKNLDKTKRFNVKDEYKIKCSYCGEKHEVNSKLKLLNISEREVSDIESDLIQNSYDSVVLIDNCIDKFINSLKNVPKELKAYNSISDM